jgi:hypothetical protein
MDFLLLFSKKGLVGVGTKASRREAYKELVGTKQRGLGRRGPGPSGKVGHTNNKNSEFA